MAGRPKKTKRELIDTGNDKRYVRRDEKGRFTEVPAGQGDRGDQKRPTPSKKDTIFKGRMAQGD